MDELWSNKMAKYCLYNMVYFYFILTDFIGFSEVAI